MAITTVMRIPNILTFVIFSLASAKDSVSPTLCMDLNSITLTGIPWTSEMEFAKTEGIFYVYDPIEPVSTFEQFKFPIDPITVDDDAGKKVQTFPTKFTFNGPLSIFCWTNPTFSALNIRFKLYEFYHTALKAISEISIIKKEAPSTISLDLSTLPYQYKDANVSVDFTLTWSTQSAQDEVLKVVPERPPIPPVQPPVDMESAMDVMTDDIIAQEQASNVENGAPMGGEHEASSDWMFIAAICSSMLGLIVLVYVCVWAYRSHRRKEYESIPSNINSPNVNMVTHKRKISLRDITIDNNQSNEQKNIMHPSAWYTFQDERT